MTNTRWKVGTAGDIADTVNGTPGYAFDVIRDAEELEKANEQCLSNSSSSKTFMHNNNGYISKLFTNAFIMYKLLKEYLSRYDTEDACWDLTKEDYE